MTSRPLSRVNPRLTALAATSVVVAALALPALPTLAQAAVSPTGAPAAGVAQQRLPKGFHSSKVDPDVSVHATLPKGLPATGTVVVQLDLAAPTEQAAFGGKRTLSLKAASEAASSARTAELAAQKALIAHFSAPATKASLLYTTSVLTDAVAVSADVSKLPALAALPGVTAVHQVAAKFRDNTRAVPLTGSPQVWATYGAGAGVNVAVIDTGIDYTHADFGGAGTPAAYNDAFAHDTVDSANGVTYFPTAKVTEGNDLVGDDYTGGVNDDGTVDTTPGAQTPMPDPNPLDCSTVTGSEGHGTHVAGIIAGEGVKTDSTTYTGTYDANTETANSFKIGPGTAPKANLGIWRVFGCHGATFVVSEALDQIAQTRVDDNPANDVNIMNLSLGADLTRDDDPDAVNINRLAQLGVLPVVAAGNSGDLYEIGGSPGSAARALTVAATDDGGAVTDALKVDSPTALAANYPAAYGALYDFNDTNVGVTGATLARPTDPADQAGCQAFTPADAALVAGKVAVLDDQQFACAGSIGKTGRATAAGAIGVVLISDDDSLPAINGSATVPTLEVQAATGAALLNAIAAGPVTVDMTAAQKNSSSLNQPQDVDKIASFTSRGGVQNGDMKPDVGAPGVSIFSAASGTGSDGISYDGTSMATPHTAGIAAEVFAAHKGYTAEQLKAAVMNTADSDVYVDGAAAGGQTFGPTRVGAGRVRADLAVPNSVLAYVGDGSGSVSANFGLIPVTDATQTVTKPITVQNTGTTDETYATSLQDATAQTGADFTVTPATVTVAAGTSQTVTLTLTLTRDDLTKTEDATRDDNVGGYTQDFVAEATGRLLLTPTDTTQPVLRVPYGVSARPASTMSSTGPLTFAPGTTKASLGLTGQGVSTGPAGKPASYNSTVSAYTLQATSPQLPDCAAHPVTQDQGPDGCIFFGSERAADLKDVGATSTVPTDGIDQGLVEFGLSTYAPWVTPSWNYARGTVGDIRFRILVDTNGDGKPDYLVDVERAADSTDLLATVTYDLSKVTDANGNPVDFATDPAIDDDLKASDAVVDSELLNGVDGDTNTDIFNSDVLGAPVSAAALGLTAGHSTFSYTVITQSLDNLPVTLDTVGPLTFDAAHPALSVVSSPGATGTTTLFRDQPGTTLPITLDPAATGPDLGLLLLHHDNVDGQRAEVVPVTVQTAPVTTPTAPTKPGTPAACVITTTTKAYGPGTVRYGPHGYKYTVKVFVDANSCALPANLGGLSVGIYVDGVKRAQLKTGKDGSIGYYLSFRPGTHKVTAAYYGSPQLTKSNTTTTLTVKARAA